MCVGTSGHLRDPASTQMPGSGGLSRFVDIGCLEWRGDNYRWSDYKQNRRERPGSYRSERSMRPATGRFASTSVQARG
jgi:hypothetical protein